jgi:hypothetical protein
MVKTSTSYTSSARTNLGNEELEEPTILKQLRKIITVSSVNGSMSSNVTSVPYSPTTSQVESCLLPLPSNRLSPHSLPTFLKLLLFPPSMFDLLLLHLRNLLPFLSLLRLPPDVLPLPLSPGILLVLPLLEMVLSK